MIIIIDRDELYAQLQEELEDGEFLKERVDICEAMLDIATDPVDRKALRAELRTYRNQFYSSILRGYALADLIEFHDNVGMLAEENNVGDGLEIIP